MPPQRRNGNRFVKIFAFAAVLFFVAFLAVRFFHLSPSVLNGPKSVVQFLTNTGLKSDNNHTNILLLGVGGAGHDGPYLTDTIMIASVDAGGRGAALISIPRDIWVPDRQEKINAVYPSTNNNLKETEQTISALLGVPIHYGVRVDFSGFERAVNLVGGLDINVDNSFTDNLYPIDGKENETCGIQFETRLENGVLNTYFKDATGSAELVTEDNDPFTWRYEILKFQKGMTHMDGKTALKYVRSRHGDNDEGSDFARSARQEKVILAFRQKVLSASTLLNPKKILDLMNTFGGSVDTDIGSSQIAFFLKLFPKVDQNAIRKITLDSDRPESKLEVGDPTFYGGAFVLLPKGGSWQDLTAYIKGEIENQATPSATPAKN